MLKINEYFGGEVVSIGFRSASIPATVGVMSIGEFEFDTGYKETVTIISGALTVKLPGSQDWKTFDEGEVFIVDANKTFQVKVAVESAYLCTYE